MAFSFLANLCNAANKTSGSSQLMTVGGVGAAIGKLVVVQIATDNASSTTDQDAAGISSVTDSVGNTYLKAKEWTNGQGSTTGGATVSIWYCVLTAALVANTSTITVNFAQTLAAKAIQVSAFTIATAGVVHESTNANILATDAGVPGSLATTGTLANVEHLFLRSSACETDTSSANVTSGWSLLAQLASTGGGAATNQCINSEYKIATATSATSAPAWTSSDNASVIIALTETSPNVTATPAGVSATSAVGSATVITTASVTATPSGVSVTSAVGTPTVVLLTLVTPTGVSAASSVGSATVRGTASVAATGVSSTSSVGTPTVTGTANVAATGVSATIAVGDVIAGSPTIVNATGVAATSAVGTVTITGTANISATGVSATSAVGTPTVSIGITVSATGVSATSAVGTASVSGTAVVAVTGVAGVSAIGSAVVLTQGTTTALVSGVSATSAIGSVAVSGSAVVASSGVSGQCNAGTPGATGAANCTLTGVSVVALIGSVVVDTGAAPQSFTGGGANSKLWNEHLQWLLGAQVAVRGVEVRSAVGVVAVIAESAPPPVPTPKPPPAPAVNLDAAFAELAELARPKPAPLVRKIEPRDVRVVIRRQNVTVALVGVAAQTQAGRVDVQADDDGEVLELLEFLCR